MDAREYLVVAGLVALIVVAALVFVPIGSLIAGVEETLGLALSGR